MATGDIVAHEWDYDRLKGLKVYSADNQRVGTIDQIMRLVDDPSQHYFLVRTGGLSGLLARDELYIPESAVELLGDDRIVLRLSAEELQHPDWTP
jgi:rRNA processing protein Gar1